MRGQTPERNRARARRREKGGQARTHPEGRGGLGSSDHSKKTKWGRRAAKIHSAGQQRTHAVPISVVTCLASLSSLARARSVIFITVAVAALPNAKLLTPAPGSFLASQPPALL